MCVYHNSGGEEEQEEQKEDSPAVVACLTEIKAVKVRYVFDQLTCDCMII